MRVSSASAAADSICEEKAVDVVGEIGRQD